MVKVQNLQIWPGCFSSINKLEGGMLVKLELSYKCIREDTLFSFLRNNTRKSKDEINDEIKFTSIVTRYGTNSKTHQVEKIDFQKSPYDTFACQGKEVSFIDYYKTKYGVTLKQLDSPMCVVKSARTGQETLIPLELCYMTGLT